MHTQSRFIAEHLNRDSEVLSCVPACNISSTGGPDSRQDDRDESTVEHGTKREIDKTAFKDALLVIDLTSC